MDEFSDLQLNGIRRGNHAIGSSTGDLTFPAPRPPSLALKRSFSRLPRGNIPNLPLRRVVSNFNMRGSSTGKPPVAKLQIHAPTPRRHLLNNTASQQWMLHTPPLSPASSRGTSPISAYSASGDRSFSELSKRGGGGGGSIRRLTSFSSLLTESEGMLKQQQSEETLDRQPAGEKRKGRRDSVGSNYSTGSVRWNGASGNLDRGSSSNAHQEKTDNATGRRWVRWMHRKGIRQWTLPITLVAVTLVKLALGLGSYSGHNTPPMYGDYEAQRHWMELTLHLPLRQWYTYDLQYWGLDYPPLTAYISWLCGLVAHWINPSWVVLDASRGIESETSKVFMRLTVVFWDALVYVPALVLFTTAWQGTRSNRTQGMALLTLLLQPALLLIDFGHFQYNSVMLGFTLLAIDFFARGQDILGAFAFVLSLGFKQMALYYAPAIGTYLLAKCIYLGPRDGLSLFVRLGATTVGAIVLLFIPFLPPFAPATGILDPITRIFPFARGLFEDKVANFWCASNVVFKWRSWASPNILVKFSTALTALGFLPAVIGLLRAAFQFRLANADQRSAHPPFLSLLPYALLTSSMSFFLFSFQVHEKTILLPLMPLTLLLSGASGDSSVYAWGVLVNNTAVFSMWPLLKRDGLGVQYIATLLLWNRLIGYNPFKTPTKSLIYLLSVVVYAAITTFHILEVLVTPPARYPDIFPVLNVLISTPVFVLTWLWSIKCGVEVGWALGGPGAGSHKASPMQRRLSDDDRQTLVAGEGYRQLGMRAMSLGHSQPTRRRPALTQRGSSPEPGVVTSASEN